MIGRFNEFVAKPLMGKIYFYSIKKISTNHAKGNTTFNTKKFS